MRNLAGVIKQGKKPDESKSVAIDFYSVQIDWNGDVLLCVQDWSKNLDFNILINDLYDIWTGEMLNKYRKVHLNSFDSFMQIL